MTEKIGIKAGRRVDEENEIEDFEVKLEGIDMSEDDVKQENVEETVKNGSPHMSARHIDCEKFEKKEMLTDDKIKSDEKDGIDELKEEQIEYNEVIAEHEKELEILRSNAAYGDMEIRCEEDLQKRINYLMAQSEIFIHFLECSNVGKNGKNKKDQKGSRTKVSEEAEDKLLMKQAQSNARVTRLIKQPDLIKNGKMRDYQLEGLNWLIKLHDNGVNGILADEMGLGKTLQCISLLAYLKEARNIRGPHIVITPKSTVGNWLKEIEMWCPTIKAIKLLGSRDERKIICETLSKREFDVLVTSYECILLEKSTLCKIPWVYLIIDEAHRIKNEKSSLSIQVRQMKTRYRLLITGTPLQNNLHELWALLNFLLPDIFSNADDFDKWFNVSGDSQQQENVIRKLHTVLRPFMLRRIKSDVEKDLPPKKEIKLYVPLTAMQREWYKRVLSKDAHALNAIGGPERSRLLNVLMQLRKVCNHPYLFSGAEEGPPYVDGPHIWENSAKLSILYKLLPRLKDQGSRVLIFSQMTRLLDILEDFLNYMGFIYCRIDGSTDGETRDLQMSEFNAPKSPIFCFLLSTRAGGLGINLQTADTVILYDSDWNPQADLQAMDRAHRIGQTRPVRVFRFVCEGTVEEKIVERADKKLFLDAAVIQQGRLAEKNSQLSKDELMSMVKFGADDILHAAADSSEFTEEDIDNLLSRCEERTNKLKDKIEKDMRHNLANFSLKDDSEFPSLFDFEGQDYKKTGKKASALLVNLPRRELKRSVGYDADAYYRGVRGGTAVGNSRIRRKGLVMQDYQFFDQVKLGKILQHEMELAAEKAVLINEIKDLRSRAKKATNAMNDDDPVDLEKRAVELEAQAAEMKLDDEDQAEKKRLMEEAFPDWTRKDVKSFIGALEHFGRSDLEQIVHLVQMETGKTEIEIRRYYKVFMKRCTELSDYPKVLERIEKGEKRIQRSNEIREALAKKVDHHPNPWQQLQINYYGGKGKAFTEEEDAYLVNMMHRYGYGNWEVIRQHIKKAWQFHFDWFFKSRSVLELQRRGDFLIRLIEKENGEKERAEREHATISSRKKTAALASSAAKDSVPSKRQMNTTSNSKRGRRR